MWKAMCDMCDICNMCDTVNGTRHTVLRHPHLATVTPSAAAAPSAWPLVQVALLKTKGVGRIGRTAPLLLSTSAALQLSNITKDKGLSQGFSQLGTGRFKNLHEHFRCQPCIQCHILLASCSSPVGLRPLEAHKRNKSSFDQDKLEL